MANKIFSIFFVILILLYGCTRQADPAKCCDECVNAYSKSPVAYGPQGAKCGHFMTGNPISAECDTYFAGKNMTVTQCERVLSMAD